MNMNHSEISSSISIRPSLFDDEKPEIFLPRPPTCPNSSPRRRKAARRGSGKTSLKHSRAFRVVCHLRNHGTQFPMTPFSANHYRRPSGSFRQSSPANWSDSGVAGWRPACRRSFSQPGIPFQQTYRPFRNLICQTDHPPAAHLENLPRLSARVIENESLMH